MDGQELATDGGRDAEQASRCGRPGCICGLPLGERFVLWALRRWHHDHALPTTEDSPLRTTRHVDGPQWENLDVEAAYLAAGAAVLRLGVVYGEHDYQRRFELVLRRVRAGRPRMPVGAGSFVWSRVYVGEVARAVQINAGVQPAMRWRCSRNPAG